MPEGPSLVIHREEAARFEGQDFVLKQHWLAHTKTICPRCHIRFVKAHLGQSHRRSFFCERCQKRYPC